jgi:photosystem II stability/assembly factor-like uncharacterized protein
MIKSLKILIGILFIYAVSFGQEWTIVSQPDFTESLQDLHFIDGMNGWGVGYKGLIVKTTDGGYNWEKLVSPTDKDLAKIFFFDNQIGWIGTGNNFLATPGGTVLKTTDGGSSWTEIDFSGLAPWVNFTYCDALLFNTESEGFMIAGKSKLSYILKTTDGGQNWTIKDSLYNNLSFVRWYDIAFYDMMKGVIVGNRKDIQQYTTDGGETWTTTTINDGFFRDLRSVKWLDENTVLAMGEGNQFNGVPTPIYKSSDGGATWERKTVIPPNSYDRIKSSYFKDGNNGIAMGTNGFSKPFIYKTTDGGESWTPSFAPYAFSIRDVEGSGDTIIALGTGSHMIRSEDFGSTWEIFGNKPPSSLYGLQFLNGKGFSVTRNSDLLENSDGTGLDWNFKSSYGLWDAGAMYFLSDQVGFVQKENQYIVKTTDGGTTWYDVLGPVDFSSRNKVGGIHFPDNNTGYAWMSLIGYDEYHVFKTTDAGETWNDIWTAIGPGSLSGDLAFFDAQTGFIAGPDIWLQVTTDGGSTWTQATINGLPAGFENRDFEDVTIIDQNTAWLAGNRMLIKTTDKGASWNYVNHGVADIDSSFYAIAFKDLNEGFAAEFNGTVLTTTDGGNSWNKDETLKDQYIIYQGTYNEAGKIFVGSSDGYILGYDVISGVKIKSADIPESFKLSQNYPNPFNPTTSIQFSIVEQNNYQLVVYDNIGQEVVKLVNGESKPGSYEVHFDGTELSSGVYYYQLSSDQISRSRKMILIK